MVSMCLNGFKPCIVHLLLSAPGYIWVVFCFFSFQLLSCSDSSVVQSALLEELSLQADVLEKISKLSLEKSANEYSARDRK